MDTIRDYASFHTTHWTQIFRAQTLDPDRRREALGAVLGEYWRPVYCYLRQKGFENEKAKDLTQGFFHEAVLERNLIPNADPAKGRFRNLLLVALERYITSVYRAETAKKRQPAQGLVHLDDLGSSGLTLPPEVATPERAFVYAWASALLDDVIAEVRADCIAADQATHWKVFRDRVIRPIKEGHEPPALAELGQKYGISDRRTVSNMAITVRRRFQRVLRARVRQLVESDEAVEAEICDLMEIFCSDGAAG
jgi:RNA polymerase sigma-70 factor (ECF subfamily)